MTTVSLTLSQVFEFALKAYQAGKLAEAEQLCLKILTADPGSAPTLTVALIVPLFTSTIEAVPASSFDI